MQWSPFTLSKLRSVRDMRLRLAELELTRVDGELAACTMAEEAAARQLTETLLQSAAETAQANAGLLEGTAGGRSGITGWASARRRAESRVAGARGEVVQAASDRRTKEDELAETRLRWRASRFDVERLRMLAERLEEGGR